MLRRPTGRDGRRTAQPRSSDAELTRFLQDSGAAYVITDPTHLAQLRHLGPPYDRLGVLVTGTEPTPDGGGQLFERAATTSERAAEAEIDLLGLDDPAWMLYTSGTTHRPNGVLSTQRAALWSVAACYAPHLGLSPDDRVLWPLPLFHSVSHSLAILGVTAVGASARIAGDPAPSRGLPSPGGLLPGVSPVVRIGRRRLPGFHGSFHGDLDVLEFPHPGIGTGAAVPEDRVALAVRRPRACCGTPGTGPS
ncbi:long-chain fatty acid--CoA ligase [Streptomyces sp. NBC_01283]|nr:long-chain fatty acid--CoA ligase [Streptomyces sp. NBC_01283]